MESSDENLRNAVSIQRAIIEVIISRLVQLGEILLRTDGVSDPDHETLERLHARRACETTQGAALPDEEPLRYPRSFFDEGNGIPRR
jgi:hypothetical protein